MFAEGIIISSNIVSFFAKNPPDFHKWPYEAFFYHLMSNYMGNLFYFL